MTPKEAFKIGFLEKCAADGLSKAETLERIQHATFMCKTAHMTKSADPISAIANLFGRLGSAALPLALLAPPIAGAAGGALLAKAPDDAYDKSEARKKELIAEYGRAVEKMQAIKRRQQAAGVA